MKPKKTVLAQEFIVFDVCTHASSKISDECVTQYKSAREITTISDPLLLELRHPDEHRFTAPPYYPLFICNDLRNYHVTLHVPNNETDKLYLLSVIHEYQNHAFLMWSFLISRNLKFPPENMTSFPLQF